MFILISMADNTATHRDLIKDTVHGRFIFTTLAMVPTWLSPGRVTGKIISLWASLYSKPAVMFVSFSQTKLDRMHSYHAAVFLLSAS